jgi:pseudo-response regulator 7
MVTQGDPATWAANRKAALEKLREKKKLRSFKKKVRYESRRRLAESRPRVRGQFVKAAVAAAS